VEEVINIDTLTSIGQPKFVNSHIQQKETPTIDLENHNLETPAEATTSQTITQQPNGTEPSQTLSPQPLIVQKMVQELIPLNKTAFELANDMRGGYERNPGATRQAKSVAVKRIIDSVLDNNLTKEQQVCALRMAMGHKDMVLHSASAGLVLNGPWHHHMLENMRTVIQLATTTADKNGRSTDDMRSIVQNIVLATMPMPPPNTKPNISKRKLASLLGLPWSTYHRIAGEVKHRREKLDGVYRSSHPNFFSAVAQRQGPVKATPVQKKKMWTFVRGHDYVIVSPLKEHAVMVPDPEDPSLITEEPRQLRQGPT